MFYNYIFVKIVLRARFSAITDLAIFQAFNNLVLPNWNESRSVDARQELDLRIGCSFTRFQTKLFQVSSTHLITPSIPLIIVFIFWTK